MNTAPLSAGFLGSWKLLECDHLSFAKSWGCIDLPISSLLPSKMLQKKCKEQIHKYYNQNYIVFICVYYACYTFRNHKTPSLPVQRCHPKVKHLEQQTRWFGIVRSSQHPKGLCTDAPCHHVQVMELYPYYILLLNLLSASFPRAFSIYVNSQEKKSNPLSVLQR